MKTCLHGHKAKRLIRGLCRNCYQRLYNHERKISSKNMLSTTKTSKEQMTKAQAKARAMKFKYKPHDIQRWPIDKIIERWGDIEI